MDPSILALTQAASIRGAGLVLDEVAVNTSMLQELEQKRRIPAVLKVMLGSFSIKMMVIPAMLAINAFIPGAILPLLTFGGVHLASEGLKHLMEKIEEKKKAKEAAKTPDPSDDVPAKPIDPKKHEKETIKKVLVIDGLLSVEISVMTLPIIAGVAPLIAAAALAATGAIRTTWMYTVIGGVLSMPRMGDWLTKRKGNNPIAKGAQLLGKGMHKALPYIVKGFEVAGTAALLMIGGGLVLHGIPGAEHLVETAVHTIGGGGIANWVITHTVDGIAGLGIGAIAHKPLEILYGGIAKGAKALASPVINLIKNRKKKPANDDTPAPAAMPKEPDTAAAPPALSTAPDAKAALNAAAAKPPATATPAPEQDNKPVQPEQPKAAPPKVNP